MVTIYVDTREKRPFSFPHKRGDWTIKTSRKKLKTGDYIPRGYGEPRGGIVVERKGYGDFISCCTPGSHLTRFKQQLSRLERWTSRVVVVEGSISGCSVGIYSELAWTPLSLANRVAELQAMFAVPIIFAETRKLAQSFALDFILHSMQGMEDLLWRDGQSRPGRDSPRRKMIAE